MKLAIFDKDGTLVAPKSGAKFVQHPEDQILLPGVADGLKAMAADGWTIAIASNQGGVAAGHKTLDSAIEEISFAMRLTGITQSYIAHSYEHHYGEAISVYWPSDSSKPFWTIHTHKDIRFRKPRPGMIQALLYWGHFYDSYEKEDPKYGCIFIGDRDEDEQAAAAAGVAFRWADDWRAQYAR